MAVGMRWIYEHYIYVVAERPSGLGYDVTAVKCCMVCIRSQVGIPLGEDYLVIITPTL